MLSTGAFLKKIEIAYSTSKFIETSSEWTEFGTHIPWRNSEGKSDKIAVCLSFF